MPELIYIHIKIQQNELYLRQYFFSIFFSRKLNVPGDDRNTTQP